MFEKGWVRLSELVRSKSGTARAAGATELLQTIEPFAMSVSLELWSEAAAFAESLHEQGAARLAALPVKLGGGGRYDLLYFLTRFLRPRIVVETGVAAGYSTQAILKALQVNGSGRLYSSDFPYFRLDQPEQYIGILVDDSLKANWELYVEGDAKNLRQIAAKIDRVDLLHYDSDKTYQGRKSALKILEPLLSQDAIIVMDDIQDNSFFHDYVRDTTRVWRVFDGGEKLVGLIGL
jgi:predicted O-methyltransferase YrrM